jgi:membrane-associated protein
MDLIVQMAQYIIHLIPEFNPETVNSMAHALGPWLYVLLTGIVFAETGLVVTPFLPGDSLLFAVGAVSANPDAQIDLSLTAVLLIAAAILGDALNYTIGYRVGPRVFSREDSRLLNKHHLIKAQRFYEQYGGKTIILARFIPIIRTFAPFVAGIGKMNYARFFAFNVIGGACWVLVFLLAGWKFGTQEYVKKNFTLVIMAIIVVSVLPGVIEFLRAKWSRATANDGIVAPVDATEP